MGGRRGERHQASSLFISELRQREDGEPGSGTEDCSDIDMKGGNMKNREVDSEDPREGVIPMAKNLQRLV